MNLSKNKSLILLHIIILIWGFTGILGKLIELESDIIVWNRMLIAFIGLFIINILRKGVKKIKITEFLKYSLIGLLIAIHWVFFFESIKLSTVSLALICLSTISLFTAILEPIIQKKSILIHEILLSLLVITGVIIVFNYETPYQKAVLFSVLSAFFAALFTVLNHQLIQAKHNALTITTWEMFGGAMGITIYLIINNKINQSILPYGLDILYILILSLICTAFAFYASIEVMKKITPFTVNLSVNLEPIYAIILAIICFGEEEKMSNEFYWGAGIILSSILINTIIKHKKNNFRSKI
ncbi:MAG: EamA family transporter [Flavobacteriales bacterium]|nr:EamA family transporter [Flavobacteriales bacterium]|tara:strand:- start:6838 stop:7731 length:894 start_codon:yes stop_codon:yes gene_type:complete